MHILIPFSNNFSITSTHSHTISPADPIKSTLAHVPNACGRFYFILSKFHFQKNTTAARKNARPEINASQSGVCFYKPGRISVAGRPRTGGEVRHIFSIIGGWIFLILHVQFRRSHMSIKAIIWNVGALLKLNLTNWYCIFLLPISVGDFFQTRIFYR